MSFLINPYVSFPAATGGAATATFLQATADTANASTYTFPSQSLGTAAADRRIIVAFATRALGTSPLTVTSATIAGLPATIAVQQSNIDANANAAALLVATVPSGTSGTIQVVLNRSALRSGIGVLSAVGMSSNTPTDTQASTAAAPSATVSVDAGGFIVATASWGATSQPTTATWSDLTERFDFESEGSFVVTGASDNYAAAATPTVTATPDGGQVEPVAVFGAWA